MNPSNPIDSTILLTFDVEDWFQVENFKQCIPFSAWPKCELRVEKNVHKILDLLDSIKLNNPTNPMNSSNSMNSSNPMNSINSMNSTLCALRSAPCENLRATFFILGWIAQRLPHLVREIQVRGHEVASHGYDHMLCREQSAHELKMDLVKSKELLEDVTGNTVYGYRAPSFSINDHILQLIRETGYLYDSSFNSFRLHGRYGRMNLNGNGGNGILHAISENFFELPVSNLKLANRVLPWGGGGYFRLIPLAIFKQGVEKILKKNGAYLFYLHPWEVDSDQPRVNELPITFRFRHYVNLDKTYSKLSSVLNCFKEHHFSTLIQYINRQTQATQ
jgi:peptidoglycan-N-acetylglucosamine deacetylase